MQQLWKVVFCAFVPGSMLQCVHQGKIFALMGLLVNKARLGAKDSTHLHLVRSHPRGPGGSRHQSLLCTLSFHPPRMHWAPLLFPCLHQGAMVSQITTPLPGSPRPCTSRLQCCTGSPEPGPELLFAEPDPGWGVQQTCSCLHSPCWALPGWGGPRDHRPDSIPLPGLPDTHCASSPISLLEPHSLQAHGGGGLPLSYPTDPSVLLLPPGLAAWVPVSPHLSTQA